MTSKVWEVMNDLEMITSKICSAREIIDTAAESIQKHEYDKAETLAMASYEFLGYYLDEFDAKFKLAWQETVVKQKSESHWEESYLQLYNRFKRFARYTDQELAEMCDSKEKEEDPCMPPWGHSDLEYLSKYGKKEPLSCDKDDQSPECKGAWNSFWEENYYPEDHSKHYYEYDRNDPNRENPFKEDKVVKWQLPVEMDPSGECFVTFPDDLLEASNFAEGDVVEWIDRGDGSYMMRKVTKSLKSDEC
jgi:hypothetical protein